MSRRKRVEEEEHDNSERWLLSYADFITLLMIFFVIMYAMGQMDTAKSAELTEALGIELGGSGHKIISLLDGEGQLMESSEVNGELEKMTESEKQQVLKETIDEYVQDSTLAESVTTRIENRGLVLSFNDSLFFDSGETIIRQGEIDKFVDIGKILNHSIVKDSFIRVEGHTDNVPMNNGIYKSNWDLSAIRASNVAQILINESGIDPARISVVGYGEYRPKADNNTDGGRKANRRVDVLILSSEFSESENTE